MSHGRILNLLNDIGKLERLLALIVRKMVSCGGGVVEEVGRVRFRKSG
jgi:hypothetical protein